MRLDDIRYADIQDYVTSRKKLGLADKSINNHLTVLRRSLVIAKKRELISSVPEIEWLKCPKPEFDFLDFDEADRVIKGADPEWRAMIFTAIRTGMRLGEMRALRWDDVDLKASRIRVCQSISRGVITTPKSGRSRTIPLGDEVKAALQSHKHLISEYVFCTIEGRMFNKNECKHPLWRACKRAGIRRVGWHPLRHTFASHLVMKGVPIRVVQELLGHATIEMTMRYAHVSPEVPFDAVKALDGGPSGISWHPRGIRMPRGGSETSNVLELKKK